MHIQFEIIHHKSAIYMASLVLCGTVCCVGFEFSSQAIEYTLSAFKKTQDANLMAV
jgi:hypothetical protein